MPFGKKRNTASLSLKIAHAMDRLGIEGLPRNYELVYDVFTSGNAELVEAFKALGPDKSQQALDRLGRSFLPHHFESSILEQQAGRVKEELANVLDMLQEEKASLEGYGQLVSDVMVDLSGQPAPGGAQLMHSMQALDAATRQRQEKTAHALQRVKAQATSIDAVREDMAAGEAQKFTDQLTGLGNRRLFNRELAEIFKAKGQCHTFGLAFLELGNMAGAATHGVNVQKIIRTVADVIRNTVPSCCSSFRFEGGRFALLCHNCEENALRDLLATLRQAILHVASGVNATHPGLNLSVSVGACMKTHAADAFDIVSLTGKALADAQKPGAGGIVFSGDPVAGTLSRRFAIYESGRS